MKIIGGNSELERLLKTKTTKNKQTKKPKPNKQKAPQNKRKQKQNPKKPHKGNRIEEGGAMGAAKILLMQHYIEVRLVS